eukprot:sb/3460915/
MSDQQQQLRGSFGVTPLTTVKMLLMMGYVDSSSSCKFTQLEDDETLHNLTDVVVNKDLVFTYYSLSCLDEIRCNGLSYLALFPNASLDMMFDLMWFSNFWAYPPKKRSVDGHLINGFNGSYCDRSGGDTSIGDNRFYLFNGSRCFPFQFESSNGIIVDRYYSYCTNGHDQTNCSDPSRVSGSCLVGGNPANISIYFVCKLKNPFYREGVRGTVICDDGLDSRCLEVGPFCKLHKHFVCDGVEDCLTGADERGCLLSAKKCVRRFNFRRGLKRVPFNWVLDGDFDCQDDVDEMQGHWITCGHGITTRYRDHKDNCTEVWWCDERREDYAELVEVCDTIDSCGNEMSMCRQAGSVHPEKFEMLASDPIGFTKISPYCLSGLEDFAKSNGVDCSRIAVQYKTFSGFFGKEPQCGEWCQFYENYYPMHDSSSSCKFTQLADDETLHNLTDVVVNENLVFTYYSDHICNGVCNIHYNVDKVRFGSQSCLDEIRCNGLSYLALFPNASLDMMFDLMWFSNFWAYPPKKRSVDGHLINGFNGSYCDRSGGDTSIGDNRFYLFNGSRCFPFQFESSNGIIVDRYYSYCTNGHDQTNCSDPSRVSGSCLVGGNPAKISIYFVCKLKNPFYREGVRGTVICDDGLDSRCLEVGPFCKLHKHFVCDGVEDCLTGADERGCLLSAKKCVRRFNFRRGLKRVPFNWVLDGDFDCQDDVDEMQGHWITCGHGITTRYRDHKDNCTEVWWCDERREDYAELVEVCDTIDSCGNEMSMCRQAGSVHPEKFEMLASDPIGFTKISPYCLSGLEDFAKSNGVDCSRIAVQYKTFSGFFGKEKSLAIVTDKSKKDCRFYFGDQYVLFACSGLCYNTKCPLIARPVLYNSCSNIQKRVLSLSDSGTLTLVASTKNVYHNNFFVCGNKNCVPYSAVCDTIDDCGDASDERICSNNFKCGARFLVLSQVCDGKIDCQDLSDECNERCSRKLIQNTGLTIIAGVYGSAGLALNLYILIKSTFFTIPAKTQGVFVQQSFATFITLGDTLTSVYLAALSVSHVIFGSEYCTHQLEWLTSIPCVLFGVMTATGSSVSSLSMAFLSCFRLRGTLLALRFQRAVEVGRRFRWKIYSIQCGIVLLSGFIACVPLFPALEDRFVNGLVYPRDIKIFTGFVDKVKHLKHLSIIQGYMGKEVRSSKRETVLSWEVIRQAVRAMFTSDIKGVQGTKQSFYGNDASCIFKYFVLWSEPQAGFVWGLGLVINCVCLVVVMVCHVAIAILTSREAQSVDVADRNRKLQGKITAIILTDFCCWVPFLVCCILHTAEVVDMTPWYSIFSIAILPLNSVLNPILYSDLYTRITGLVDVHKMTTFVLGMWNWIKKGGSVGNVDEERVTDGSSRQTEDMYVSRLMLCFTQGEVKVMVLSSLHQGKRFLFLSFSLYSLFLSLSFNLSLNNKNNNCIMFHNAVFPCQRIP